MNITIVEDELKLARVLQDYLQQEGYSADIFSDGQEALANLQKKTPDLVLLDLMLPGLDGMSICRELRKTSQVPIIMLTARSEEIDRLLGLELGADDYICKPFSPREVVARVKAVLRRTTAPTGETALQLDNALTSTTSPQRFQLNDATASVSVNGKSCSLTAVELKLLQALIERPGHILNRNQLMKRMYDDNRIVSDRTIDSHVKKLRHKLEALNNTHQYVHSVYGIGYKFEILDPE